jgi:prepilin-type N-terminal cleavage/methylation domain-containing protein
MKKHSSYIRGLTLSEILVVVAIVSVIMVVVGTFQSGTFKRDRDFRARIMATEEARLGMRRFLEETRMASQSSEGAYAINSAQNNALTFYADTDNDGLKERFRYYISGSSLMKATLKPSGSPLTYTGTEKNHYVAHNISTTTASLFVYYDTNNATITSPVTAALVRSVRLSFYIKLDPNIASSTVPFSVFSTFRNLKDFFLQASLCLGQSQVFSLVQL